MRFTSIPTLEKVFQQTGNQNEYTLQPVDLPVPGETLRLSSLFCKPLNRSGYFHDVEHPKQRIVMHFTAGNLRGDMSTLTRQDFHVSVAFVIARDGTIYQLFPSKFWSGHLGKGEGNVGTGNAQDKATIGIEISNYGYLTKHQGNLETIYSRLVNADGTIGPADVYCSLDEEEAYEHIDKPFRDQTYYATHTDAQYESLIVLLRYLTVAYNIPRAFLPEDTRFETTPDVLNFRGVVSHINYRTSGKWDIGPSFDWNRVMAGVQAPVFIPTLDRDVQVASESDMRAAITSEDDLLSIMPQARDAALEDEPYEDAGLPSSTPPASRNVYALVVGINAYRKDIVLNREVIFPALSGCVDDAGRMANYLKQQPGIDAHIKYLINEEATKTEIVKQIREHLGQQDISSDDTVLLYFSGHGTQEYADAAWDEEIDGKLECLVCYYESPTDDFLLADKELRYLIHNIWQDKKPHVVTLFDCCHSGDNTRAVSAAKAAFSQQQPVEKRISYTFSQRDWSRFVFADKLPLAKLKTDKTAQLLPEGTHVSMSACEDRESAVEVGGEGVFTKALVNILQSTGGNITYNDLQSRVRAYLRSVYEQQPRFRVAGGSAGMLYRTFLGGSEQQEGGLVATILHNPAGWTLDKGAIQGINEVYKTITGVAEGPWGETKNFTVKNVFPDYTTLEPQTDPADETIVYKVRINGLMARKLRVAFELEDISREDRATLLSDVMQRMKGELIVVEKTNETPARATRQLETDNSNRTETSEADYVVRGRKGQFYLTYPIQDITDDSAAYRPLVEPIGAKTDAALDVLASDLQHVARWEYIRQLENTSQDNRLPTNPLLIELWQQNPDGSEEKLPLDSQDIILDFKQNSAKEWTCPLRVDITNQSNVDLYVSALYLSMGFGSDLSFLPDEVFLLEKGKSVALKYDDDPAIPFGMSDIIPLYNWPERVEYFKFIASTVLFSPHEMQLELLPAPSTPAKDRGEKGDEKTSTMIKPKPKPKGWVTQRVDLHWQNPIYNQIEPDTIREMLKDEALADFALGLYFENNLNAEFPSIQLKSILRDLTANEPLQEKGMLGDFGLNAANWIANKRRNHRYKKAIEKNPNQTKIVSEGDSWFQHPLVADVIDHLAAYYPVYCVAAAGDTLRNIIKETEGEPPVEEYIAAINKQNPDIFVLSGGGNDILGEQFRGYIKGDVISGPDNPADYLEDLLSKDLDSLQTMYRKVFTKLKVSNKNLKILVHGYDYIIPLSVTNKGWLGRYMIEKGIDSHEVRKAILRYILTEFNIRMKAVADEFPDSVSYIVTPGTVADDEWYDEIHPNGVGFGKVAEKFKIRIDELMRVS